MYPIRLQRRLYMQLVFLPSCFKLIHLVTPEWALYQGETRQTSSRTGWANWAKTCSLRCLPITDCMKRQIYMIYGIERKRTSYSCGHVGIAGSTKQKKIICEAICLMTSNSSSGVFALSGLIVSLNAKSKDDTGWSLLCNLKQKNTRSFHSGSVL